MKVNKGKTNFMHGYSGEAEEMYAYQEMLDYLIQAGKYPDVIAADNDARDRVRFCEEMDLYADDARLKNASVYQRKIQALIHSNKLQDIIAENDGYLPGLNNILKPAESAAADEVLPVIYPVPNSAANPGLDHYDVIINQGRSENDFLIAKPAVNATIATKDNSFTQLAWYITKALIMVFVLLAGFTFFFNSSDILRITKYSFLLFIVLLVAFVTLSEVSGKLMMRLRYTVSYLFFLTAASLSGLLFLQQPWVESAFSLYGGFSGIIVNFIIHRVIIIGPFWLGVFFAAMAFVLLLATWLTGRKIREGLPENVDP
jgi:hypothetical protein